ncbi:MAG TPA: Stp1/IreP family PP2C-type Ser/Thr phosphatase [Acidimicrobiia bacterium]|nr:Stp1/IreP family PP2C-type Ser/Thr phosphatase [Acidimicrobiia bacterium]
MTLHVVVGAATDTGRVRDHNEDAFLVDDQLGLFAVADGMGGHQAGEVASAIALEALRAAVTSGEGIRDAVTSANDAVYEKSTTDDRLRGMGTTLTAGTLAAGDTLLLGHVGDSRAYVLRDHRLERLTTDHSLVEELIQAGELTEAQAEHDPRRSMITRALGIEPTVEVDLYPIQVHDGDRLLLCSDGLTGMVGEDEIENVLTEERDANQAAHRLVDEANAAGGIDNITVLIVDLVDAERETAAVPIVTDEQRAPPEEPVEEPADEAREEPQAPRTRRARPAGRHRLRRILLWALPVLVVLGVAFGVVDYYAHHTYFVGSDHGRVTVFQGRPGGLLFWNPTVKDRTSLPTKTLTPADASQVKAGHGQFGSIGGANSYVSELRARAAENRRHTLGNPNPVPTTIAPPAAPTAP